MHLAYWSIAQSKDRETEPSGMGWELFKNYLIALEKYKPDYFLYENNYSMSKAIRAQISKEFGFEGIMINSALVSAQQRKRLYWAGKRNADGTYSRVEVEQPEDRGILLRDILESAIAVNEKSYALTTVCSRATPEDTFSRKRHSYHSVPLANALSDNEMQYMLREVSDGRNHFDFAHHHDANKDKSQCVTGNTYKGVPYNVLCEPVRIGTIESTAQNKDFDSCQYRVYSADGNAFTICGNGGGVGAKTGLYIVPAGSSKKYPIYEVRNGKLNLKGVDYHVPLSDGFYIIRKLTVTECMRLQTVPSWYDFSPVSASQAYKMLGNGWTCDVIEHILNNFTELHTEPVEVLSMYDGMSAGRIALENMGANVIKYYATEIDKYAIKTTQHNFPDTIQLGDAFQVRDEDWRI